MIDTESGVAREGVPEILPERVHPFTRVQRPQRVGPALPHKAAIGVPYFGPEQRVIDPALGRVHVEIGWHDVVIASEHDRLAGREQARRLFRQTVAPAQVVIEFWSAWGGD